MEYKKILCEKLNFFKNRNINLMINGILLSNIFTAIYMFSISLYILTKSGSPLYLGGYISIPFLINTFMGPWIGTFCDRFQRKMIVILCDVLHGFMMILTIFIIMNFAVGTIIFYLYAFSIFESILNIVDQYASFGLVKEVCPDKEIPNFNSFLSVANQAASILGTLIAGLILNIVSIEIILLMNACSYFITALLETFIKPVIQKNKHVVAKKLKGSILCFLGNRSMLILALTSMMFNFLLNSSTGLVFVERFHEHPELLSLLKVCLTLGIFLFASIININKENIVEQYKRGYFVFLLGILLMYATFIENEVDIVANGIRLIAIILLAYGINHVSVSINSILHFQSNVEDVSSNLAIFNTFSHSLNPMYIIAISQFMMMDFTYVVGVTILCCVLATFCLRSKQLNNLQGFIDYTEDSRINNTRD